MMQKRTGFFQTRQLTREEVVTKLNKYQASIDHIREYLHNQPVNPTAQYFPVFDLQTMMNLNSGIMLIYYHAMISHYQSKLAKIDEATATPPPRPQ